MTPLRDLPIRRKLILVMMLTSTVAILVVMAARILYEVVEFRNAIEQDLSTQAQIIGGNCAAALDYDSPETAEETLRSLAARPDILAAGVYRNDGTILASYSADGRAVAESTLCEPDGPPRFEHGELLLGHRITRMSDLLGTVYVRSNLWPHYHRLIASIAFAVTGMLVAWILALALARRLQRIISDPILNLAGLTGKVKDSQDYSLRANNRGNDEIGELTDGFNRMLENIQERDAELHHAYGDLQASERRFRQLAEGIHEVFWLSDLKKDEIIYISPGYETIWGRTCFSLYKEPRSWLEAIHPEDRESVTQAALTKQASGNYDQEYRIVRPDGSIRWIRDRAFPVRDANGEVCRIAGIASDITERRRLEKEVLEVSEREQARIGRDLHDGLAQHLVGTAFAVGLVERKLREKSLVEAAEVAKIGEFIDQAITQLRHVARGMHPVKLEAEGLCAALEELCVTLGKLFGVECRLDCPQPVFVGDHAVATHLYRIAQEAAINGIKHGRATRITLRLGSQTAKLTLSISDNGGGFVPPSQENGGMGLHIMNYRARLIGATLQINPHPETGTIVEITMPLLRSDGES